MYHIGNIVKIIPNNIEEFVECIFNDLHKDNLFQSYLNNHEMELIKTIMTAGALEMIYKVEKEERPMGRDSLIYLAVASISLAYKSIGHYDWGFECIHLALILMVDGITDAKLLQKIEVDILKRTDWMCCKKTMQIYESF